MLWLSASTLGGKRCQFTQRRCASSAPRLLARPVDDVDGGAITDRANRQARRHLEQCTVWIRAPETSPRHTDADRHRRLSITKRRTCQAGGRVRRRRPRSVRLTVLYDLTIELHSYDENTHKAPRIKRAGARRGLLTLPTRRAEEWDSSLRSGSRRGPVAARLACVDTGRPPSPSRERVSSPRKCLRSPVPDCALPASTRPGPY
jgi:hypothetical protein